MLGLAARDLSKVLLIRFLTYQKSNLPYTLNPNEPEFKKDVQEIPRFLTKLSYVDVAIAKCVVRRFNAYISPLPPPGDLAVV